MADEQSSDNGTEHEQGDDASTGHAHHGRRKVLTAKGAIRRALQHLEEITGRSPESVTSVQRGDDYGWVVSLDLVEVHRIPDSSDILAVYEVELDASGEMISYRRRNRYSRGRPQDDASV